MAFLTFLAQLQHILVGSSYRFSAGWFRWVTSGRVALVPFNLSSLAGLGSNSTL